MFQQTIWDQTATYQWVDFRENPTDTGNHYIYHHFFGGGPVDFPTSGIFFKKHSNIPKNPMKCNINGSLPMAADD
jgi:hypothetical protein